MSTTRRAPTGKPGWPKLLIAGTEKSGKSLDIARCSAAGVVGMTYWITFGERSADEYAQIPGAKFELYEPVNRAELKTVVKEVVELPRVDPALPNCIALDSATTLWELVSSEAHAAANKRTAKRLGKDPEYVEDGDVGADLWNTARDRWYDIVGPLLAYEGLVLFTARLDEVMEMEGSRPKVVGGKTVKRWKPATHKRFVGDVDGILQYRGAWPKTKRGVVGLKSLSFPGNTRPGDEEPAWQKPEYGIADLLRDMNVTPATVAAGSERREIRREGALDPAWRDRLIAAERIGDLGACYVLHDEAKAAGETGAVAAIIEAGHRIRAAKVQPPPESEVEGSPVEEPADQPPPDDTPNEVAPDRPARSAQSGGAPTTAPPVPIDVQARAVWKKRVDAFFDYDQPRQLRQINTLGSLVDQAKAAKWDPKFWADAADALDTLQRRAEDDAHGAAS
jgi:hypothetical protein